MMDSAEPPSGGRRETQTAQKMRIKNKLPAPVQITAEQLLREASERLGGERGVGPRRLFLDAGRLDDHRQRERTRFEDALRRNRSNIPMYLRYAAWEQRQCGDMARARSIYERAVAQDPREHAAWLAYGEAEMRAGHVAAARNVWDRAVTFLPRHDQFWYKRLALEEAVKDVEQSRAVFDRWMQWEPDGNAWRAYIRFEVCRKEWHRARLVWERMLLHFHKDPSVWRAYAAFEENDAHDTEPDNHPDLHVAALKVMRARWIWERSLHCIDGSAMAAVAKEAITHLVEFAKFELRSGELERARAIYTWALPRFPDSDTLRHSYVSFEKQHGDPAMVTGIVLERRRRQYERRLLETPYDYDGWFDLIRLEEELFMVAGDSEQEACLTRVRDAYERAIAQVPPIQEKRHWRRYIYLWLFYAVFEELSGDCAQRAIDVLMMALKVIPHSRFTFAKAWMALAAVQLRTGDLQSARLTFGQALGRCPKQRLFKAYLDMELELREFDRCRQILEKWLEFQPGSSTVWCRFAELEAALGEEERARAIYELAIGPESVLDIPELAWKAYIDWEVAEGRGEQARRLYQRLLALTQHVKIYVSWASMELSFSPDEPEIIREIMRKGYHALAPYTEDRMLLLESWRQFELLQGQEQFVESELLHDYYPNREMVHDPATGEDREVLHWPEPGKTANAQRLLGLAKRWKQGDHQ